MDTLYIGFTDSDLWTKTFLKKGFGHCCILIPLIDCWLQIDPTSKILELNILKDHQVVMSFHKFLRVQRKDFNYKYFPVKFCSCVTTIEYILGKRLWAITPYRLYKKLTGKFKEYFKTEEVL